MKGLGASREKRSAEWRSGVRLGGEVVCVGRGGRGLLVSGSGHDGSIVRRAVTRRQGVRSRLTRWGLKSTKVEKNGKDMPA